MEKADLSFTGKSVDIGPTDFTTKENNSCSTYYDQEAAKDVCIVVDGAAGVGKSNITHQFINGKCAGDDTLAIEYSYTKYGIFGDSQAKFEVLDRGDTNCGSDEKHCLKCSIRRGRTPVEGVMLVYSVTSRESFEYVAELRERYLEIKQASGEWWPFAIVGNKSDLEAEREVSREEGAALAKSFGYIFFEVSAKDNAKVEEVFRALAREITQYEDRMKQETVKELKRVVPEPEIEKRKGICESCVVQ
ncbi:hypothetical protein H072_9287 [Dactylellina haptotyla CBS 200.50]|uniref:Uncharacterized protein n=1 Tax=Dactylellina haptotyla (strain CBS 200.50) TaxID=1284197 RepID=S8BPE7_DACHA|nr:hypothetical protein H072_9287 [Dactylellina haptotyla CBS 200.50]